MLAAVKMFLPLQFLSPSLSVCASLPPLQFCGLRWGPAGVCCSLQYWGSTAASMGSGVSAWRLKIALKSLVIIIMVLTLINQKEKDLNQGWFFKPKTRKKTLIGNTWKSLAFFVVSCSFCGPPFCLNMRLFQEKILKVKQTVDWEKALGEGPASQPQSTLSRCKNLPPLSKILTPLNLVPKKLCWS